MDNIDNRIVNLQFNNKDFEKNAATTLETCEKLDKKLTFKGVIEGLAGLSAAAKAFDLSPIVSATETAARAFNPLEEIAIGALRRIGEQALQTGEQILKSVTVDQIEAGYGKFDEKTQSVQTIMSATGKTVEEVNEQLQMLNWYTDETSYAYTDMTSNIGKFTNAGVKLEDAVTAMVGIGNAAGLAGANVRDASHAMAGFSKAMGQGYMDRLTWSWIKTAHMDTIQFKQAMIDSAVAAGKLIKLSNGMYSVGGYTDDDHILSAATFESSLTKSKWLTSDIITKTLAKYGETTQKIYDYVKASDFEVYTSDAIEQIGISMEDLGLKAFKASQEAKTFSDAIEAVRDAVSTGWMTSFELIIGNYMEAKKVWTDLANWMYDIFVEIGNERNKLLKEWQNEWEFGTEGLGGRAYLFEGIYEIFDTISEYIFAVGDAFKKVFGEDWDTKLLRDITQGIHDFAQALSSTVKSGVFDYETKGGIRWFITNVEQLFHILKRVGETLSNVTYLLGTTVVEALGFTSVTRTMKRSWDATGEAIDSNITKIGKVVYSVLHGINAFLTKNFYGNENRRRIREIVSSIGDVVTNLKDIFVSVAKSILKAIGTISSSFSDISFSGAKGILSIIKTITSLIMNLVTATNSVTGNTKLTDIFINILDFGKGILAILKVSKNIAVFVIKIITSFVNEFKTRISNTGVLDDLSRELKDLGDAIKDIFASILGKSTELSERGEDTSRSFGWIALLADILTQAIAIMTEIIPMITKAATKFSAFVKGINVLIEDTEAPDGTGEKKRTIVDSVKDAISSIFDEVDGNKVTESSKKFSGSVFSGIFKGIADAINKLNINWSAVGKFVGFIGFLVGMTLFDAALFRLFNIVNMALGPAGLLAGLTNFITGIGGVATAARDAVKSITVISQMKQLALALAILAGAVWLLGQLPKEAIARGIVALGLIAVIFGVMMKVLNLSGPLINYVGAANRTGASNFLNRNSLNVNVISDKIGIAAVIMGITAFVLVIAHVLNALAKLDLKGILKGLTAVTVVMGLLIGAIAAILAMGKMIQNVATSEAAVVGNTTVVNQSSRTLSGYLIQLAAVIGSITIAVMIFTAAISAMATIAQNNPDGFWKACLAFVGMMVMLSAFIAILSGIQILSSKKWGIDSLGRRLIETSIALIGIAAGLSLLMVPVTILAGLQKADVDLESVMFTLLGYVIGITAFSYVLSKLATTINTATILKAVGIIAAMVIVTNGIIPSITALSKIESDGVDAEKLILDILGLLVGIVAIIAVFGAITSKTNSKNMLSAATMFTVITQSLIQLLAPLSTLAVLALAGSDLDSLIGNIIVLTGALAVISGLLTTWTKSLSITSILSASAAFLIMSLAVGKIIWSLGKMKDAPNLESMLGLGILLVAMGGVLAGLGALFNKIGNPEDLTLISTSMVVMSVGLIAIAGALAILNKFGKGLEWKSIGQFAAVIGILAGTVVLLGALTSAIPPILPVMQVMSSMIASVALVLISFGAALFLVAKAIPIITEYLPEFMDVIKDAAKAMEEHIGVFLIASGVVVALAALVTVLIASFTRSLPGLLGILNEFINSISQMSLRGKAVTTAFVMALVWGLAEATPEVMDAIETSIKAVLERLGQSLGWIVDGLLKLIIGLLDALADAIRANGGPILFAIVDILEAIGELILDALAATIGTLFNLIVAAVLAIGKAAKDPSLTFAEAFQESFAGRSDSMSEGVKGFKEAAKIGMEDVKKFLYGLNGYEDTELKLFGDSEEAKRQGEKEGGEFFDKLIEGGKKAAGKVKESLGLDDTISSLKDRLLNGEIISTDEFTKLFNMEGFDPSKMLDMQSLMDTSAFNIDPSTMMNWQEATAGFTDFSTTVTDGNADMEAATVSFTDTAGDATGDYVDELANSNEDAELKLTEGVDKLETIVNNRQDNFKQAGRNLIQALEDGVTEKWEAASEVIKSKFRILAEEIRDILSGENIYGDITPVINANNPYEYQVAAQSAVNRESYEKNSAFAIPTTASVSTEQAQLASTSMAGLQATITANSNKIESLMRVANDKLDRVVNDNDLFHKSFDAYRAENKNKDVYIAPDKLVGAIGDEMYDYISVSANNEARSGG